MLAAGLHRPSCGLCDVCCCVLQGCLCVSLVLRLPTDGCNNVLLLCHFALVSRVFHCCLALKVACSPAKQVPSPPPATYYRTDHPPPRGSHKYRMIIKSHFTYSSSYKISERRHKMGPILKSSSEFSSDTVVPVLNKSSRHEDELGEWRYSTIHS
jgi:hypothetical protein